jgi:hypothetical protein
MDAVSFDDFCARFAALLPRKPKPDFHPNTLKIARAGDPGLSGSSCARISTPPREKRVCRGPRPAA